MGNGKRHTDLRPVGQEVGKEAVQRLSKRLEVIGAAMTVTGLFVSIGGLETVVGLVGICLSYLPRSKRLMRWVGDKFLPKLKH